MIGAEDEPVENVAMCFADLKKEKNIKQCFVQKQALGQDYYYGYLCFILIGNVWILSIRESLYWNQSRQDIPE